MQKEIALLREGGVSVSKGDVLCLLYGHLTRAVVHRYHRSWDPESPVEEKLRLARTGLREAVSEANIGALLKELAESGAPLSPPNPVPIAFSRERR